MGIIVKATTNEATIANAMVKISSRKKSAANPVISRKGKNAANVVSVEAAMAELTSLVPLDEASTASLLSLWWREIFSNTTIALSTNIPTPKASPPSDMILRVNRPRYIIRKVAKIAIGMAMLMMSVRRMLARKKNTTNIAKIPPPIAILPTLPMDALM